jgi:lycopene beta-cyclase
MAQPKNHGLLIAGGGLSASLAALAMARIRPEVPMLLVGEGARFGGERPVLLFDAALGEEERAFVEPLMAASWDGFYVAMPGRSRRVRLRCHALSPETIGPALAEALPAERRWAERRIVAVRDTGLLLHGGETVSGTGAIDARTWAHQTTLDLAWRHSTVRTYEFSVPHRVDLPVLLDTTLPQAAGCAFFACLPLSETRLAVEHVRYAAAAEADPREGGARLEEYVSLRGWTGGEVAGEDRASLPVALGGDFEAYYRIGGARVAKLGKRGGFFFPTTGAPLPDAIHTALLLTRQRDFSGGALHDLFEAAALASWKRREAHRSFDRLLLRDGGCRAIEGLFGLEAPLIERFFAERLGLFDRRKLMAAAEA